MSLAQLAGWSALVAAAATAVGMVSLFLFFNVGGRWGRLNDASSVVLMLALVPVAVALAAIESATVTTIAVAVAALGIVGMLAAAVFQAMLIAGRGTFEGLKNRTLGASALVGVWYVLAGFLALTTDIPQPLAISAIVAGVGLLMVSSGFVVGGERHPASTIGGALALAGSVAFLGGFGVLLLTGRLVVPEWNI